MAVPCANYLLEAAAYNHEMGKIKKRKHLSDTKQCLIEPIIFINYSEIKQGEQKYRNELSSCNLLINII